MNGKPRNDILFIVLIGILIVLVSLILGILMNRQLDGPQLCSSCHEMLTFYDSYMSPPNGSILIAHNLTCIQCHANKSVSEARKEVAKEIIINALNISGPAPSGLVPDCTKCHIPQSPVHQILNNSSCTDCHWAHSQNVSSNTTNISLLSNKTFGKHMEKKCQFCHGMNFEIPRCITCHMGHGDQKLDNDQCLSCHSDPHVPKIPGTFRNNTVTFKGNLSFSVCKPCHENQYSNLTNSPTLHTEMGTCTKCHQWHGEIPKCKKCHPGMMVPRHPRSFRCSTCHADLQKGIFITCQDCHGRTHEWSAFTAVINPK
ncbi:MAG TPA: hypothetical protein VER35_00110 [Candidatus Limnocylindrales bacterium]|nr:hypothetical protein [Candidatus Limnocylindrales bacterium]